MSLPLKLAVACFVKTKKETLLIDYRNTDHHIHAGKYAPSGGKLEKEEYQDPKIGAKRELLEETNIKAHKLIYRGKVTFLNEKRTINGEPMDKNWEVYFYDCYEFDASNARAEKGTLAWVANDKVLGLPLHEGDRVIWEWLSKYKAINAEIKHTGEKLTMSKLKSFTLFIN